MQVTSDVAEVSQEIIQQTQYAALTDIQKIPGERKTSK